MTRARPTALRRCSRTPGPPPRPARHGSPRSSGVATRKSSGRPRSRRTRSPHRSTRRSRRRRSTRSTERRGAATPRRVARCVWSSSAPASADWSSPHGCRTPADDLDCTLIDKADAFVFGYSKLDLLFGKTSAEAIRVPYSGLAKPGVRFRQEAIESIDPRRRRVVTDLETYDADVLVIALGADYDTAATPGLDAGGE